MLPGAVFAASEQMPRAHIGVQLDPAPLPILLTKHLGLDEGQGLRVSNVVSDSPADKAGIERDDIIIRYGDRKATDLEEFVGWVREHEAGKMVGLVVIHQGQKKEVTLNLVEAPEEVHWKYVPEPEQGTAWQPGRVFRFAPGEENWMEIPFEQLRETDESVSRLFIETYSYKHELDGKTVTVTIKGNPNDEDARIYVKVGKSEYSTVISQLDALPEQYRDIARQSLEQAIKARREKPKAPRPFGVPRWEREYEGHVIAPPAVPHVPQERYDRLEKRLDDLYKRLEELEIQQKKLLERLEQQVEKTLHFEVAPLGRPGGST